MTFPSPSPEPGTGAAAEQGARLEGWFWIAVFGLLLAVAALTRMPLGPATSEIGVVETVAEGLHGDDDLHVRVASQTEPVTIKVRRGHGCSGGDAVAVSRTPRLIEPHYRAATPFCAGPAEAETP